MKKFIAISSAAALTASMVCAPIAIVSAADDVLTDTFAVVMEDQAVVTGTTKVKIPVSFNKDISFATADMKFSTAIFPKGGYDLAITSIESALPADSGISVDKSKDGKGIVFSSAKDYTLKKGAPLLYINTEIQYDGVAATDIPSGATFKVSLDDCDIADENRVSYEFSPLAIQNMNSVVQITPEKKTENFTVKIDSISTASKTVLVPMYVGGEFSTFRSSFKVDGGAKIVSIDSGLNGELEIKSPGILYVNKSAIDNVFSTDKKFITVTVELPDGVQSGDTFKLSPKFVDAYSKTKDENMYPSQITPGVITYQAATIGDYTITDVKPVDKFIVSDSKELDLSKVKLIATVKDKNGTTKDVEVTAGNYFKVIKEEGVIDRIAELEYTGPTTTSKIDNVQVNYLRAMKGDVTLNGEIDVVDSTILLRESAKNIVNESILKDIYISSEDLAPVIKKYGIDTIVELGKSVGDVDGTKEIDVIDSTLVLRLGAKAAVADIKGEKFDYAAEWDKLLSK